MTFKATDIFHKIYQEMIISGVRHRLGEYYTPGILCKKMIAKCYKIGDRVLDPSCGSGTFLIEIYRNIDQFFAIDSSEEPPIDWFKAINNIYGFDINPIAVLTSKANLLLYLKDRKFALDKININIYLYNSINPMGQYLEHSDLNESKMKIKGNFMDLIITNPPWLTYKDANHQLKEIMKKISDEFNINPGSKNITNIEEAVIFLFKIPQLYLRDKGKVSFVLPRSILVSSQNEKARRFDCFDNIEIYEFNDLVFNIDCCCFFANYIKDGFIII
jgi:type I restriction-modification system DNA methylase subunit